MIISHKYKFIFLKTRKTAGTSIEIALSKFCGRNDIITEITPEDEIIRKQKGYLGPQNYFIPFQHYRLNDWKQRIFHSRRLQFYNHTPAYEVHRWIGADIWNQYYKFSVERNPWDKAVSRFYFMRETGRTKLTFREYLQQRDRLRLSNFPIYTIHDKLIVDCLVRYESLSSDLEKVAIAIGLPDKLDLPRAKGYFRKDKRPYRELYREEEKQIVFEVCQKEIELLGYQF